MGIPGATRSSTSDRRRHPRFEVRVTLPGHASSTSIRLSNVSQGGCLAYAGRTMKADETYVLQFTDTDGHVLSVNARVMHAMGVTGDPETVCAAGLAFVDPNSPNDRLAIGRLLALVS